MTQFYNEFVVKLCHFFLNHLEMNILFQQY
jgi:hypothetical protein